MINHVRTLILNETTSDEFVPAEFVPMTASPVAKRVRGWLFHGLDQSGKDERMYQVMQLLHTPAFERYVLAPDSRVTYLPFKFFPIVGDTRTPSKIGGLVDVVSRVRATLTAHEEKILFAELPEFYALWHSDKALNDIAGLLLGLAYHADIERHP